MANETRVSILLTAKNLAGKVIDEVRGAMGRAAQSAESIGAASERAASKAKESFGSLKELALGLGEAMGVAFGAHKVIEAADAWKLAEGQLRIVTDSTAELRAAQDALFNVAQRTRTGFEANVMLYARLTRATRELHLSSQQLVDVTEAVARAAMLSGASQQTVENGYYQLGQALAMGKLQAQDARSIIEDMPRLGQALAEGMGLTMAQFREQMLAGKVTSQAMVDALQKVLPTLRDEAAQVPLTVGQAMTQLNNAFTRYVGETDRGLGATNALSAGIGFLANHITALGNVGFALLVAWLAKTTVGFARATGAAIVKAGATRAVAAADVQAAAAAEALTIQTAAEAAGFGTAAVAETAAAVAADGFSLAAAAATVAARVLSGVLAFMGGWVGLVITAVALLGTWVYHLVTAHKAAAEAQRKHAAEIRAANDAIVEQNSAMDQQLANLEAERAALRKGGTKAAEKVHDEVEARNKAAEAWDNYRRAHEGAAHAALTFNDALAAGDQTARGFLNREEAIIYSTRQLRDETEKARKAEEARDPTKALEKAVNAATERIATEKGLAEAHDHVADRLVALTEAEAEARALLLRGNLTLKERLALLRTIAEAHDARAKAGLLTYAETPEKSRPKVGLPTPVAGLDSTAPLAPGHATLGHGAPVQTTAQRIGQAMKDAVGEGERLDKIIANMTSHTFQEFGSAVEDAMAAVVDGSAKAGKAFEAAFMGALAAVADGFGQFFLAKATGAIGDAFLGDPGAAAAAAEYTAAAMAMFAVAGALKGAAHKVGGAAAGGASSSSATLNKASQQKGDANFIIEGGLLDMSDPRQEQALARAIESLSGRRVIMKGAGKGGSR